MTYHELLQKMNVTDSDLKSHLIPLCQYSVLTKNPKGKEFKPDDVFKVNWSYHNNSIKVKVPIMHSKKAQVKQDAEVVERVEEDRKHMIEAVIVKIMKTRKRLSHQELILESTKILLNKFKPDPAVIKKRIEALIERDYLERDKEDRKYYSYLA